MGLFTGPDIEKLKAKKRIDRLCTLVFYDAISKKKRENIRLRAIKALAEIGSKENKKVVMNFKFILKHPGTYSEEIQAEAAKALGKWLNLDPKLIKVITAAEGMAETSLILERLEREAKLSKDIREGNRYERPEACVEKLTSKVHTGLGFSNEPCYRSKEEGLMDRSLENLRTKIQGLYNEILRLVNTPGRSPWELMSDIEPLLREFASKGGKDAEDFIKQIQKGSHHMLELDALCTKLLDNIASMSKLKNN